MARAALLAAACFVAGSASAAPLSLVSAEMGPTNQGAGRPIDASNFLGWRFQTTTTMGLSHVGGHLRGISGTLFVAVVSLPSATAMPQGAPFVGGEVVASTTFTAPIPSDEILVPLSAVMPAGHYAVVIGAGQFSSLGNAIMPTFGQPNVAPTTAASYISWRETLPGLKEWTSGSLSNLRFVVRGSELAGPTDFNLDGRLDGGDLAVWRTGFGKSTGGTITHGNADGDADVDGADFLQWQRSLVPPATAPATAAIPEPAGLALALAAAAAAALVGRRGGR
jgi:hypothetical protein